MTLLQAVILGVLQGLTEFIPVSSTGHLVVGARLLGVSPTEFLKTFEIIIQTGSILAVLPLFFRRVRERPDTLLTIGAAFLPIAAAGVVLYPLIRAFLGNHQLVSGSLIAGGVVIVLVERYIRAKKELPPPAGRVSLKEGFLLGCFQCFALVPGVSRSGATIIGGLLRGLNRVDIVEFSFLLSVPTIVGAGVFDLFHTPAHFTPDEIILLSTGFVCSWISAVICVKAFLSFISRHSFQAFGWYRIIAGIIFSAIFLF